MLYTNIRAVISRLALNKDEYQDDDIIEWIMQGFDVLGVKRAYEREIVMIDVTNHRAMLPCDLIQIELITAPVTKIQPCQSELEELDNCGCGYNESFLNQVNSHYNYSVINNYTAFTNTAFFKNHFQILRLSNKPFAGKYHCSTCPNLSSQCEYTYSLSSNGYITVPFESGVICLSYLRNAKDENGEYLIPQDEDLIQALANWCMAKHWEMRANTLEQGAFPMYQNYINIAQNLFQKVRGKYMSKGFRFQDYKNIVYKNIMWANSYTIFSKRR